MPVPTAYTEAEFSDFLEKALGDVATALSWGSDRQSFDEIVIETLMAMDETDVENVVTADLAKLRTLGKVYLWQAVMATVSGDFDFSADGGSYSRSQVFAHADQMLTLAERQAAAFSDDYVVGSSDVTYHRDPYADHDDSMTTGIDEYQESLRA